MMRIDGKVDFATSLHANLLENAEGDILAIITTQADRLDRYISRLSNAPPGVTSVYGAKLDSLGTKLWNVCTRLLRGCIDSDEKDQLAALLCRGMLGFFSPPFPSPPP